HPHGRSLHLLSGIIRLTDLDPERCGCALPFGGDNIEPSAYLQGASSHAWNAVAAPSRCGDRQTAVAVRLTLEACAVIGDLQNQQIPFDVKHNLSACASGMLDDVVYSLLEDQEDLTAEVRAKLEVAVSIRRIKPKSDSARGED